LERKVLRISQYRVGPRKVGFNGIFQPFSDAIKLFFNQVIIPFNRNFILFLIAPLLAFIFTISLWIVIPLISGFLRFSYSVILFLIVLRFGVYPILVAGWASNRKYAVLGAIRTVAQTISYEIRLALILIIFIIYINSFNFDNIFLNKNHIRIFILTPFISIFWLVSCLAETNRTPFDFSEGESELVSGFNIDYSSGLFAIIFIAEYARIYILRFISIGLLNIVIGFYISTLFIIIYIFFWIWARATLPRFRYDLLIHLAWKIILPVTLGYLELVRLILFILL